MVKKYIKVLILIYTLSIPKYYYISTNVFLKLIQGLQQPALQSLRVLCKMHLLRVFLRNEVQFAQRGVLRNEANLCATTTDDPQATFSNLASTLGYRTPRCFALGSASVSWSGALPSKIIPAWNPMSLIDRDHFVSDIRAADVTRSDLTALLRATDRCFDSENEWSKNSVIL